MKQKHSIELPFSLSLFMVFVLCSFMILLLQINGYHRIVNDGEKLERIHTPLAYIKTSIRSSDVKDAITLFEQDGAKGIKITNITTKDVQYIYQMKNSIKELHTISSLVPDFTTGEDLFEVASFDVYQQEDILSIVLQDSEGQSQELNIRINTK